MRIALESVVANGGGKNSYIYGYKIGGKTGTAQVSKGSDTVLFVGFAPYENPQIAVAVVVENGNSSARASSVAADIFDYYFESIAGTSGN